MTAVPELRPIAHTMTAAIGTILPHGPWSLRPDERDAWAALEREDGANLWFEWTDGRVYVSGRFPRLGGWIFRPKEHPTRISIDERKPVERLAAEIDRRYLSAYLPAFAEGAAMRDDRIRACQHAERLARRLGKAAGVKLKDVRAHERYSETEWSVWTEHGSIRVTASEPHYAHVEARLSISDDVAALRVARAMRKTPRGARLKKR